MNYVKLYFGRLLLVLAIVFTIVSGSSHQGYKKTIKNPSAPTEKYQSHSEDASVILSSLIIDNCSDIKFLKEKEKETDNESTVIVVAGQSCTKIQNTNFEITKSKLQANYSKNHLNNSIPIWIKNCQYLI